MDVPILYETTTSEKMQECVDGWILDIQNSIRTLRNIQVYQSMACSSPAQREAIQRAVQQLSKALQGYQGSS